jgi:hypothetical protein
MKWQNVETQVGRVLVRLATGVGLGVVPGALYGALAGVVHRAAFGRWDSVHAFTLGCIIAGAVLGLLGAVASAWWSMSPSSAASPSQPIQGPVLDPVRRPFNAGTIRPHSRPALLLPARWTPTAQ